MSPEGLSYLPRATQQDRHSRTLTFESMLWLSEDSGSGFSKRQHEHSPTWQARNVFKRRGSGSWAEALSSAPTLRGVFWGNLSLLGV